MRTIRILLVVLLIALTMAGCQTGEPGRTMVSVGRALEQGVESAGDTLRRSVDTTAAAGTDGGTSAMSAALTLEQAQEIALEHAGFRADQVTALHTEYEIEHGIPQYDVEFHHEHWEYDYEIHADTGEILSFSKDD